MSGARPLVGHGLAFRGDRLGLLDRARATGAGAVVLLPDPVVVLTEPDDLQHVLVQNAAGYSKGPKLTSPRGQRAFGKGLLTEHGERHARLRLLVLPAFHRLAAGELRQAIGAALADAVRGWRPGQLDVHDDLMRGARLAIQRVLFGELPDADRVDRAIAERRAFAQRWFGALSPRPEWLPTPANARYRRTNRWLRRRVAELVDRSPGRRSDLLSQLAASRTRQGDRLTRDELVTEALSLTVPGHETTGEALAWTLDLLARHPDAQEQARHAAQRGDRVALERVVDESLRLFPPTWVTVRVALRDDLLPCGAAIAQGQRLYVSPWVVHRDPRWWAAPDRFDPDRFRADVIPDLPRRAHLPFGAGPRGCVGERVARTELVEGLRVVLARWRLFPVGPPPVPDPGLTLAPRGGARLRLEQLGRSSSTALPPPGGPG